MTRLAPIASALRQVAGAVARLVRAFLPEPGTTEGAVLLGMLLLAAGFVAADLAPLALLVPGAILVILGSLPAIASFRGRS